MKKRLKWIIPVCAVLLVAVGTLTLALRPRASGKVLWNAFAWDGNDAYLVQFHEQGAEEFRIGPIAFPIYAGKEPSPVYSPNGRYAALTLYNEAPYTVLLDLNAPKESLLNVDEISDDFLPTNDGRLLYVLDRQLYCADGASSSVLDRVVTQLHALSADGARLYYIRKDPATGYELCVLSLSGGTPEVLVQNILPNSVQLATDADGRQIVCAAQKVSRSGTAYDCVLDTLEEADLAMTAPDAAAFLSEHDYEEALALYDLAKARIRLREELRATEFMHNTYTLLRWVDGRKEVLAEGVMGEFFLDPLSGMSVHLLSALYRPVVDITSLHSADIPHVDGTWYCSMGLTCTPLDDLGNHNPGFQAVFTGDGTVLYEKNDALFLRRFENGVLSEPERLGPMRCFSVLHAALGGWELYYIPHNSGKLYCRTEDETTLVAEDVLSAYLPCLTLPNGTKQRVGEAIYLRKYYNEGRQNPEQPPNHAFSERMYLAPARIYLLQDGVQLPLLQLKGSSLSFYPIAALPDGSLLSKDSVWRILHAEGAELIALGRPMYTKPGSTSIVTLE